MKSNGNGKMVPQARDSQAPRAPAASRAQAGAPAAPAPVPLPSWFKEIDTANKGEVTRDQFLKYRMKTFDQLDTNKDGMVSMDEMKAWMAAHSMSDADMSKGFYKGFGFMPNNQK